MNYITTFDMVFFALCGLYVSTIAVDRLIYSRLLTLPQGVQRFNLASNITWCVALASGFYFSMEGCITFLFACVVLGVSLYVYERAQNERRLQRELLNDLSDHMVDTLRSPNSFK